MSSGWYRLDNSGMIYPMVVTLRTQSLYRLGVTMNEKINPNLLRVAVNVALERYPYYKVELRSGLFRHYLDENMRTPLVEEDDGVFLKILNFHHNRHYLFRVTYYKNRIFIDFFHGLCDGTAAAEFFKTILFYYFRASNRNVSDENVKTIATPISEGETEDAFKKYYKKISIFNGVKKMASGNAFKPKGKQFLYEGFGCIQGEVSTELLLKAARAHNCTVTAYLSAMALLSVAEVYRDCKKREDFIAFIPINLRKFYPSDTMFNFTNFAKCPVPKDAELTLDTFINYIKDGMKKQLTEEELQIKLSFSSLMDVMPIFKFMPVMIKGFLSRLGRGLSLKSKQTMIISNLGEIKMDGGGNINSFAFNLNCAEKTPVNMGVVSYNGKTVISFTRKLVQTKIEKIFFGKLKEECGNVKVVSNFREECEVL